MELLLETLVILQKNKFNWGIEQYGGKVWIDEF